MLYRIVVGDRNTVRGVVELDAVGYDITALGALVITAASVPPQPMVTYAPGAWRSITDVERFKAALKAGISDENSGRRQETRPSQAL